METVICQNTHSVYNQPMILNPYEYHQTVTKLREFFIGKGFLETSTQNCLSILAACEDPYNISVFNYPLESETFLGF